jgi:cysteine synthase
MGRLFYCAFDPEVKTVNPFTIAAGSRTAIPCPRPIPVCLVPADVLDCIGNTPMVHMRRASIETGCTIMAKAEYLNPGGSVKDRIAKFMLEEGEKRGDLKPGHTILEVTSGNTGIALAMVGGRKGYRVVIVMPKTVSEERRKMILSFGAELELLEELNKIQSAVAETEERALKDPTIFLPRQFSNRDNPLCHETTTGPEIIEQTGGRFDAFIMGVGTGGTLMGVGRAIRKAGIAARVIAVEPDESAVMSGDPRGHHNIQGLADGFIPDIVQMNEVDQIVRIKSDEALQMSRQICQEEGLLVGISSGANILAAKEVAQELGPGHTIVTVLADRGERYLSVK